MKAKAAQSWWYACINKGTSSLEQRVTTIEFWPLCARFWLLAHCLFPLDTAYTKAFWLTGKYKFTKSLIVFLVVDLCAEFYHCVWNSEVLSIKKHHTTNSKHTAMWRAEHSRIPPCCAWRASSVWPWTAAQLSRMLREPTEAWSRNIRWANPESLMAKSGWRAV